MVQPVPGVMTMLSSLTELLTCSLNFYIVTARNTLVFFFFFFNTHRTPSPHTILSFKFKYVSVNKTSLIKTKYFPSCSVVLYVKSGHPVTT